MGLNSRLHGTTRFMKALEFEKFPIETESSMKEVGFRDFLTEVSLF